MPEPISISIVAIYVAKKIVEKIVVEQSIYGLKKLFFPQRKYITRLSGIISDTINDFKNNYPEIDTSENYYFFDSEIILTELSNHILLRTKYDYDYTELKKKFEKYPKIIIPSDRELTEFFECFVSKVNQDKELVRFQVDENYKNEIFNISKDLKALIEITESIQNKLIENENEVTDIFKSNNPLNRFIKKTTPIDLDILEAIRNRTSSNNNEHYYEVYKNGLDNLNKAFIKHSLNIINRNSIEVKKDNPDIVVEIELKSTAQYVTQQEKLNIKNPLLLWDCNCKVKYPKKYNKKPCLIHSEIKKVGISEKIEEYFTKGLVDIKTHDLSIYWIDLNNLWPPSVDSLYLVDDLKSNGYCNHFYRSIIDIGCGTGFLGIWLAKNNSKIKEIYFTDWLLLPLIFTYFNCKQNNLEIDCLYKLGLNVTWISNQDGFEKLDLAICNPPYLTLLSGDEKFKSEMTVAGTELLTDYIANWDKIAKKAVISFSDIALPEARKACREANVELVPLGEKRQIPFRVNAAYSETRYISKLLSQDRIKYKKNNRFPYWHFVQSYELKKISR
jgi:2-polyprenyl-3-methyl-5-hydroxy-6-metoxy-1,4-benzoquinol methylase